MKTSMLRGIVAAVGVSVFAGQVIANAGSPTVHVVSTATLNSYPGGDPGTCDPATFLPKPGDPACVASLSELYDATGDFEGSLLLEITYVARSDGNFVFTGDFQTWSGSIDGVGSGTFVVNEYDLIFRSDRTYTSKLRVVDGTGTGEFVGIKGQGRSSGDSASGVNIVNLRFPDSSR